MPCVIPECGGGVHSRGMCNLHYRRMLNSGKRKNPCGCGCGGLTQYKFLHGHHTRLFTVEEQSRRGSSPNNGNSKRDKGVCDSYRKMNGRHEHRAVAEKMLGRTLTPDDVVHHKNHDKKDNRPENLQVMTRAEHMAEHRQQMVEAQRANRKSA